MCGGQDTRDRGLNRRRAAPLGGWSRRTARTARTARCRDLLFYERRFYGRERERACSSGLLAPLGYFPARRIATLSLFFCFFASLICR